jgi:hypothetical protein
MKLTKEAGDCEDGPCPGIYGPEENSSLVVFQGDTVGTVENVLPPAAHEARVALPRDLVLRWAAVQLGVEPR